MNPTDTETEREFEEAVAAYGGIMTKICYYFSSNSEEFKDLRQEILINIWKGWKNFKGNSKLSSWIYRVSFNTCISYQRKEKNVKNYISLEEAVGIPMEEDSDKLRQYEAMHRLIRQLNYQDRAIILMWLDEKSYEEIAELMGIPRNTIAVRIKRIKEKIVRMSQNNPE